MVARRRGLKFAVMVIALLVSALAAEIGLRLSGRFPIPPVRIEPNRPELFEEYKPYGYRVRPSRTMTYLFPKKNPRRLTVRSNRHGFRNAREIDSGDSRPRILVLGDSMVFGDGVEEAERFTERLESDNPAWRVDNLGISGFGPDLMVRALEVAGLATKPRVVILTIYTDDFRRVRLYYAGAGYELPRFVLRSGRLVSVPYPRRTFWARWSLATALREVTWRLSGAEWDLNAAILDRFGEDAAREGFIPVVMFLPGRWDTPNDYKRRSWLRAQAEKRRMPFLDLTDPILSHDSQSRFIENDHHLNESGHAVVAREIANLLRPVLDVHRK